MSNKTSDDIVTSKKVKPLFDDMNLDVEVQDIVVDADDDDWGDSPFLKEKGEMAYQLHARESRKRLNPQVVEDSEESIEYAILQHYSKAVKNYRELRSPKFKNANVYKEKEFDIFSFFDTKHDHSVKNFTEFFIKNYDIIELDGKAIYAVFVNNETLANAMKVKQSTVSTALVRWKGIEYPYSIMRVGNLGRCFATSPEIMKELIAWYMDKK